MTPAQIVGQALQLRRKAAGLTQEALGKALGEYLDRPWVKQAVSDAERGRREYSAAEILALSAVLKCPIGHLLLPANPDETIDFPSGRSVRRGKWSAEAEGDPLVREALGQLREEMKKLDREFYRRFPEDGPPKDDS